MTRRILTAYEWPPTPLPGFWEARDDDLGEASPVGRGETQQAAIDDLMAQMEDAG